MNTAELNARRERRRTQIGYAADRLHGITCPSSLCRDAAQHGGPRDTTYTDAARALADAANIREFATIGHSWICLRDNSGDCIDPDRHIEDIASRPYWQRLYGMIRDE